MDFSFIVVQFLNGLASASALFIIASGLTLVFGVTRIVNFAHGAFYMLGAYVGYTVSRLVGFWPALVLAPLAVGVLGALFERACEGGAGAEELARTVADICDNAPGEHTFVYDADATLQDKITAVPLSSYGKPYTPPPGTVDPALDTKAAVREQVNALDGAAFFTELAKLLKDNPPAAGDAPVVAELAKLGVVPGQDFDPGKPDLQTANAIADAPRAAQTKIPAWATDGIAAGDNQFINGWLFTTKTGNYGTNFLQRAYITWIGLGANLPEDAIYPTSEGPAQGQKYSGANKYVVHFNKGELPPVQGFWSLTMYDADYFFVDNPLNRYTLSQRNQLKENADGSVDLYLQADNPGSDKESNWLPAPAGTFILMLRMYWPNPKDPSIIDGSWKIPAVVKK